MRRAAGIEHRRGFVVLVALAAGACASEPGAGQTVDAGGRDLAGEAASAEVARADAGADADPPGDATGEAPQDLSGDSGDAAAVDLAADGARDPADGAQDPVDGTPAGADAAEFFTEDPFVPRSGSRLKVAYLEAPGGLRLRATHAFFDSQRDELCTPAALDRVRCLPTHTSPGNLYADPACQEAVFLEIPGQARVYPALVIDDVRHLYEPGVPVTAAYSKVGDACQPAALTGSDRAIRRGDEIAPTSFVAFDRAVRKRVTEALDAAYSEGDDGARMPAGVVYDRRPGRGQCSVKRSATDQMWRCYPGYAVVWPKSAGFVTANAYADAACSRRAGTIAAMSASLSALIDLTLCADEARYFLPGPALPRTYSLQNGVCTAGPDLAAGRAFEIGPEMPPADFEAVPREKVTKGRYSVVLPRFGNWVAAPTWGDVLYDEVERFSCHIATGALKCLPDATVTPVGFADPACSNAVVALSSNDRSCTIPEAGRHDASTLAHLGAELASFTQHEKMDQACLAKGTVSATSTTKYFAVDRAISIADLPSAVLGHE